MNAPRENIELITLIDKIEKKFGKLKGNSGRIFISRLSAGYGKIRRLYFSLYGGRPNSRKRFDQLLVSLFENYRDRPETLKKQDLKRSENPLWLEHQKWVGMSLYPNHFSQDLKSLEKKTEYFEELGVNLVHLMPPFDIPDGPNDGGYAVKDYRKIRPDLGKMSDIRSISKRFRKKGILLALDLVLNHTSDQHQWAKKAKAGSKKYQEYYYIYPDRTIPDQFEAHMPEVFPTTAPGNFTHLKKVDKWVMTVFNDYQWDLNYTNPQVLNEMVDTLLFLANQGADIIRLDAPAFVWKQIGTNCQNLPETHAILQLMKACAEIVSPGLKFLAEAIVPPQEIVKYFGNDSNSECDIAYNATLMALIWESLATSKTRLLVRSLRKLPQKPPGTTYINYVRGHDDIGFGFDDEDIYQVGFDAGMHRRFLHNYYTGKFQGSQAKGELFMYNAKTGDARISGSLASLAGLEKALADNDPYHIDLAIKRILLSHALIMSFGGLPLLFSGDEIGQLNDYRYLKHPMKKPDNRWQHRPKMDWELAEKRSASGSIQHEIFSSLHRLIDLRKKNADWADINNLDILRSENQHVFAFSRSSRLPGRPELIASSTVTLANFAPSCQSITINVLLEAGLTNPKHWIDSFSNQPVSIIQRTRIELQPYQFCFISSQNPE